MPQQHSMQQREHDQIDPLYRYNDGELVNLVRESVDRSPTDWQSRISNQRATSYEYYYGEQPWAQDNNTSDFVSREVFDTVEAIKAKLMRTFTSSRKVVRFKPTGEQDVEAAKIRTDYVYKLFFDTKENGGSNGYKLLHDGFHDGLLSKMCCYKINWQERKVSVSESFTDIPIQQLEAAGMDPDVEFIEIESEQTIQQPQQTPYGVSTQEVRVASGTISRIEDKSGVEVSLVPPEDVFFTDVADLSKSDLIVRYEKARFELVQEGFDAEQVYDLTLGESLNRNYQEYSRHSNDDSYDIDKRQGEGERALVSIYEAFMWLDMYTKKTEPSQSAQLWHIVTAGNKILLKERVDTMPFRFWSPIMLSHKAIGMSEADITMDLQNATSLTIRGMLDHIFRVNAGSRMADMEKIRNPRDFIDNPVGGVIDIAKTDMDAIQITPQAPLSPVTGVLLDVLAKEKEKRTGDTALGKGLEAQSVISHQNSGDMIDTLINAGNERIMQMARSFAELCFKPMLLDIYQIGLENGQKVMLNAGGKYQMIDMSQVPYADIMEVDVALTPEGGENRAAQLMQISAAVTQNPILAPLFQQEEQYASMSEVYDLLGFPNYMGDPKDPNVQKRMQAQKAEAKQMKDMQIQMAQMELKLKEQATMIQGKKVDGELKLKKEEIDLDSATEADDQNLEEREFSEHKRMNKWAQFIDLAEYKLEKDQERPVSLY